MHLLTLLLLLQLGFNLCGGAFNSAEFDLALREQDLARVGYLTDTDAAKRTSKNFGGARDRFYRVSSATLTNTCQVMKLMGEVEIWTSTRRGLLTTFLDCFSSSQGVSGQVTGEPWMVKRRSAWIICCRISETEGVRETKVIILDAAERS